MRVVELIAAVVVLLVGQISLWRYALSLLRAPSRPAGLDAELARLKDLYVRDVVTVEKLERLVWRAFLADQTTLPRPITPSPFNRHSPSLDQTAASATTRSMRLVVGRSNVDYESCDPCKKCEGAGFVRNGDLYADCPRCRGMGVLVPGRRLARSVISR